MCKWHKMHRVNKVHLPHLFRGRKGLTLLCLPTRGGFVNLIK